MQASRRPRSHGEPSIMGRSLHSLITSSQSCGPRHSAAQKLLPEISRICGNINVFNIKLNPFVCLRSGLSCLRSYKPRPTTTCSCCHQFKQHFMRIWEALGTLCKRRRSLFVMLQAQVICSVQLLPKQRLESIVQSALGTLKCGGRLLDKQMLTCSRSGAPRRSAACSFCPKARACCRSSPTQADGLSNITKRVKASELFMIRSCDMICSNCGRRFL